MKFLEKIKKFFINLFNKFRNKPEVSEKIEKVEEIVEKVEEILTKTPVVEEKVEEQVTVKEIKTKRKPRAKKETGEVKKTVRKPRNNNPNPNRKSE